MQVIVPCSCGTRFSFELEQLMPRLPEGAELKCPSCGLDGVAAANGVLNSMCAAQARSDLAAAHSAQPAPVAAAEAEEDTPASLAKIRARGVLGALAAGAVATASWYLLTLATGFEIGYMAWGVGALVGFGCRWAAGERDYHLGLFAGACSFVVILLAQWLVMNHVFWTTLARAAETAYTVEKDFAQKIAPLKTDAQLKQFLSEQRRQALENNPFASGESPGVNDRELARFKRESLPKYQRLSSGKLTKSEYVASFSEKAGSKVGVKEIFNASLSIYTILWLVLGVGSAWRLAGEYGTADV